MRTAVPPDFEIQTARLRLRACTLDDAARMTEIQSNWNVTRMLRLATWPPTETAMRTWLKEHAEDWAAGRAYRFGVELEGRLIGCADIDGIEGETGDIGYWLEEQTWNRGYASEAVSALVSFAFETLGLRQLTTGYAIENTASARVLAKHGFRIIADGVRHNHPRGEDVPYRFVRLDAPEAC